MEQPAKLLEPSAERGLSIAKSHIEKQLQRLSELGMRAAPSDRPLAFGRAKSWFSLTAEERQDPKHQVAKVAMEQVLRELLPSAANDPSKLRSLNMAINEVLGLKI